MRYLEVTLPDIAENLALDEALLESNDRGVNLENNLETDEGGELLRIWQAHQPFVVLGRSSRVEAEIYREYAEAANIPIFRRASGGASIVAAPGCLFYALILSLEQRPHLRMLDQAHQFVMSRMLAALQPLVGELEFQGTCDLTLRGRKISGNSVRLVRDWMLYHGTLLLDMDLELVDRLLKHPQREPGYRQQRAHRDFLTNLHLDSHPVISALRSSWQAKQVASRPLPMRRIRELVAQKYSQASWTYAR